MNVNFSARAAALAASAALASLLAACNEKEPPAVDTRATATVEVASLKADRPTLAAGESVTLQWLARNASECEAGGSLPGWSGNKAASGSETLVIAAAGSYDAKLVCRDDRGRSDSRSVAVTVTVQPQPITIDFSANPTAFVAGKSTRLRWTTGNASRCEAAGDLPGWSGDLPVAGERSLTVTTAGTFLAKLLCSNTTGADVEASIEFTVGPAPVADRYALANGCFALRSLAKEAFAKRNADGSYEATATGIADAEPFYMKPTALGTYLFYAKNASFLAVSGTNVASAASPGDAAVWTVDADPAKSYFKVASSTGKALAVDQAGKLVLADPATVGNLGRFWFDAATGCTDFPEISVNVKSGKTFKGKNPNDPVLGFADVHLHVGATDFLGGTHHGRPFHRFGVEHALSDCAETHGEDGHQDYVGNIYAGHPEASHETAGWPTFPSWPHRDSLTHEQVYYKWLERAWMAGMRILVNDLVENETLCTLRSAAVGDPQPPPGASRELPTKCNEMDTAERQAYFMYDMEKYIDAQEGGPGKGWFRIVKTPDEARAVINEGKLAVVLGVEISHLFNCGITRVAGQPVATCDQAEIDAQLDRLYELGVRQMFPIHEFDNAFGGNGIFDGFVLNLGNRYDTGQFWSTYNCPEGGTGSTYFYNAGAIMNSAEGQSFPPKEFFGNPIADGLVEGNSALAGSAGQQFPFYDTSARQCNAFELTDLGRYAFKRMMEKNIVIEVDHLELSIKDELIALAQRQTPDYPLVSTHGGHGGITNDQARDILALGGIIYPMHPNGGGYVGMLNKLLPLKSAAHDFAMGYGADTNGFASQAGPRGGLSEAKRVKYPFKLFAGEGWGEQFKDFEPVEFDKQISGDHAYDTDADGMAHYGMIADWVEEVRLEGGEQAITHLYNSAEVYLQMWERTVAERTVVP